jgi:hypothetical protein
MQILQFETFAARANEVFSLELGESNIDMRLVHVARLKPHPYPGMRRDPFSLIFKCTMQTILPQRTYSFKNDVLGTLSMFIVPRGRDRDGIVYEATFN